MLVLHSNDPFKRFGPQLIPTPWPSSSTMMAATPQGKKPWGVTASK